MPTSPLQQLRKPLNLSKLPRWKARVEIAKDVIAAIALKKILPYEVAYVSGQYCHWENPQPFDFANPVELKSILGQAETRCSVCALGAALVAVVAREDAFLVRVYGSGSFGVTQTDLEYRLRRYFSPEQMTLIEIAYERDLSTPFSRGGGVRFQHSQAMGFGYRYEDPSARLTAIMQNIIRHRGEFRP